MFQLSHGRGPDRSTRIHMSVLIRAITYAILFIGVLLIYLPMRLLTATGLRSAPNFGLLQIAGVILGILGAAIALWCIASFVRLGKGTPAPFDPPTRLVVRGPYRFVRNPMYRCSFGSDWCRFLLPINWPSNLCWSFSPNYSLICARFRGASPSPQLWSGISGLLRPRQAMVTKAIKGELIQA